MNSIVTNAKLESQRTVAPTEPHVDRGNPSRGLIYRAMRVNAFLLGLVFLTAALVALLEGTTFAFVVLALDVLSTDAIPQFAEKLPLRAFLNSAVQGLSPGSVFTGIVVSIIGIQVLRSIVAILNSISSTKLATNVQMQVQETVFRRVMEWAFPCASRYRVGDLANWVVSPSLYVSELIQIYSQFLAGVLLLAAYIVLLVCLSWKLLVAALLLFGSIYLIQSWLSRSIRQMAITLAQSQSEITRRIVENIHALRLLHAFDCASEPSAKSRSLKEHSHLKSKGYSPPGTYRTDFRLPRYRRDGGVPADRLFLVPRGPGRPIG